jgi:hypothetical protein
MQVRNLKLESVTETDVSLKLVTETNLNLKFVTGTIFELELVIEIINLSVDAFVLYHKVGTMVAKAEKPNGPRGGVWLQKPSSRAAAIWW